MIFMENNNLDFIIPVGLDPRTFTPQEVAETIISKHKRFGVKRFLYFGLSKGWRSIGYPPRDEYIKCAEMGAEVKKLLVGYDIEIGWTVALTLKSGKSDEFKSIIRKDGSAHPFSSCPLDDAFRKRFVEDVVLFAKIVKPAFIFTEDDYSVEASSGCYCENHLNEFAKRVGRYYSREELVEIFSQKTDEAYALLRKWRELKKDTMVSLSAYLREELDKVSPETELGYMQSGGADEDGDATEAIARAMAGDRHTPYSRLFGAFYCGVEDKKIPEELYHALYTKQHTGENFKFYHETDAYPHSKFYAAGKHMKAMLGTVLSYGFDGSIFFESSVGRSENVYGDMYAEETERFNEVYRTSKKCTLKGVELDYDPFWNTVDKPISTINPLWTRSISRFGIPFVSVDSNVAFWDVRQARHADHDTIMDRLSKGLFVDGDAAKVLCERGYSKYLGVEVGEDVIANTPLGYDLGASEVVRQEFTSDNKAVRMPCAHMWCPHGNGKWLKIDVTDENCEIVSDAFTFRKEIITTAMTRFENELGGRVVVMSLTLDGNNSQALFNYDRQRLIQNLLTWCSDEYVYIKDIPDMSIVINEAKEGNDFIGFVTMTNLCPDKLDMAELHLPEKWENVKRVHILGKDAVWKEIGFERTDDGIIVNSEFEYCEPVYIKMS